LGALLFSNKTYRETVPVVDASGVLATPFSYDRPTWSFDWRTGVVVPQPVPIASLTRHPLFVAEIKKYTKFWNTEFAPKASVGYKVWPAPAASFLFFNSSMAGWCRRFHDVDVRLA
jgi:hypothetical protein